MCVRALIMGIRKGRWIEWREGKCLKRDLPPLTVHIHAFSHQQAGKIFKEGKKRESCEAKCHPISEKMLLLSHTVVYNTTTEDFIFFSVVMKWWWAAYTWLWCGGWESQEKKGHAWMFLMCVLSRDGFLLYAHLSKGINRRMLDMLMALRRWRLSVRKDNGNVISRTLKYHQSHPSI